MGKYLRRDKKTGDFAVMEVSPKSSCGVRTRAKTLALQLLQNPSSSSDDSFSFLELRNRRLLKFLPSVIKPKEACKDTVRSSHKANSKLTMAVGAGSVRRSRAFALALCSGTGSINYGSATSQPTPVNDAELEVEAEVSFGENMLEDEELSRKVRETTPTSLNSEDIGTPGSSTSSSTRPSYSTNTNRRSSDHRNIPTTMEMEEFFRGVEQSQLKLFTEKYNYDPVNDCPLAGRYEWIKLG